MYINIKPSVPRWCTFWCSPAWCRPHISVPKRISGSISISIPVYISTSCAVMVYFLSSPSCRPHVSVPKGISRSTFISTSISISISYLLCLDGVLSDVVHRVCTNSHQNYVLPWPYHIHINIYIFQRQRPPSTLHTPITPIIYFFWRHQRPSRAPMALLYTYI